jgi:hypothetical protein
MSWYAQFQEVQDAWVYGGSGEGQGTRGYGFHNRNALEMLPVVEDVTAKQVEMWLKGWNLRLGEVRARL